MISNLVQEYEKFKELKDLDNILSVRSNWNLNSVNSKVKNVILNYLEVVQFYKDLFNSENSSLEDDDSKDKYQLLEFFRLKHGILVRNHLCDIFRENTSFKFSDDIYKKYSNILISDALRYLILNSHFPQDILEEIASGRQHSKYHIQNLAKDIIYSQQVSTQKD